MRAIEGCGPVGGVIHLPSKVTNSSEAKTDTFATEFFSSLQEPPATFQGLNADVGHLIS